MTTRSYFHLAGDDVSRHTVFTSADFVAVPSPLEDRFRAACMDRERRMNPSIPDTLALWEFEIARRAGNPITKAESLTGFGDLTGADIRHGGFRQHAQNTETLIGGGVLILEGVPNTDGLPVYRINWRSGRYERLRGERLGQAMRQAVDVIAAETTETEVTR